MMHHYRTPETAPDLQAVSMQHDPDRLPRAEGLIPIGLPVSWHDVCVPASIPCSAAITDAAAAFPQKRRKTPKLIMELLANWTFAPVLVRQTGVSRQRVNQILHQFNREGKVHRVLQTGASRRYLWIRADLARSPSVPRYSKPMLRSQTTVLNCLSADALYTPAQIARHLGRDYAGVATALEDLTAMRLVAAFNVGGLKFVSLTPSGLAHPEREVAARKLPSDYAVDGKGWRRMAFIELLSVLGEARTLDLTAALQSEAWIAQRNLSGSMIQAMMSCGLIEAGDRVPGRHSRYRLTEAGRRAAAAMAAIRPPPLREHIEARLAAYRAKRAAIAREHAVRGTRRVVPGGPAGARTRAEAYILRALEAGPLPTNELNPYSSGLARHPRSIHLMLQRLRDRGSIRRIGKRNLRNLWALESGESP